MIRKRRLTRKQEVIIGVAAGSLIILKGIVAGLWFNIMIGTACLVYTLYRALKTE